MKDDLIRFFDKFVEDFKSFDGLVIANRYLAPYSVIKSDKSVSLYKEQEEIEQYFSTILLEYKNQNVEFCTYDNFEYSMIGQDAVLVTMDWSMIEEDGTLVTKWRESYILISINSTLKIVMSIDH